MHTINLAEKLALITEHWRPKVVGELNGQEIKLAKCRGEFPWHNHADADELFLVLEGTFTVETRDQRIDLAPGELLIIPRGTEHRTIAEHECAILIFEPANTRNTGNIEDPTYTAPTGVRI